MSVTQNPPEIASEHANQEWCPAKNRNAEFPEIVRCPVGRSLALQRPGQVVHEEVPVEIGRRIHQAQSPDARVGENLPPGNAVVRGGGTLAGKDENTLG